MGAFALALGSLLHGAGCTGQVHEPLGATSDSGITSDMGSSTRCPPNVPDCPTANGGIGGIGGTGGTGGQANPMGSPTCPTGDCANETSTCNPQCSGGQVCQQGQCVCPGGLSWCAATCVDIQSNDEHCGGCLQGCSGGSICQAGQCVCPQGQTRCGEQCIDLQTSMSHCGSCGTACEGEQVCMAGRCEGPTGPDGCGGEALGLTVDEVAVYQSVKIPVMEEQTAIAPADRSTDIVSGRETLFRVFVDVETSFASRELSARVTLNSSEGDEELFFAKQTIDGESSDEDTSSTFQVFVPPESIHTDTSYRVDVVECSQGASGSTFVPSFPSDEEEDVALGARETGPLKVNIVPVRANSMLPDTSEEALALYRDYLQAMFPVDDVQLMVGSPIDTSYPIQWSGLLEQIRAQRITDGAPDDIYYYGMVRPTDTLAEYCRRGCTAGVGYVGSVRQPVTRASVGLAYADGNSLVAMAHELGHNHGRQHAPCSPGGLQGVDPNYPPEYPNAIIGVWGYDSRDQTFFHPERTTDMMGYCQNRWISDYTYQGILERVATVSGSSPLTLFAQSQPSAAWRVLLVDGKESRWSVPFEKPVEAYGTAESADVLDAHGAVIEEVTVYRTQISDVHAASILVPPAEPGWHAVRVEGAEPLPFSEPVSVPEPEPPQPR